MEILVKFVLSMSVPKHRIELMPAVYFIIGEFGNWD